MRYQVRHITTYQYEQPTALSYNEAWMYPRELAHQRILQTVSNIVPETVGLSFRKDFYGNSVAYFSVQLPHTHFEIEVVSEIERNIPSNVLPGNINHIDWGEVVRELNRPDVRPIALKDFMLPSPMVPYADELKLYASNSFADGRSYFESVSELNSRIYQDFEYNQEYTTVATPLNEIIKAKKGVCQDFAHFAIGCIRVMGLAARYVSGYIETLPPEGEPQLVGSAASHAWFSVYIPKMGWVDFDPTNNQVVKSQHITVAWGRDYADVPPLKGVIYNSAPHELGVRVEVNRI